ncbi:MAG: hypothetical protein AAF564_20600 [Bacteroidota bacterium]
MVFLATHIGLWILAAFGFGLAIGWFLWGQWVGIDMNRDFKSTAASSADGPTGSIAVLSDSLLKTQRELELCQQSLANAETRMKDANIRFSPSTAEEEERDDTPLVPDITLGQSNGTTVTRDNLKKIYGIGPVIERKLAELDITTYRQIAMLTDDEKEIVSDYINYFPGRIDRDGWTESARDLHRNKYGEELE